MLAIANTGKISGEVLEKMQVNGPEERYDNEKGSRVIMRTLRYVR